MKILLLRSSKTTNVAATNRGWNHNSVRDATSAASSAATSGFSFLHFTKRSKIATKLHFPRCSWNVFTRTTRIYKLTRQHSTDIDNKNSLDPKIEDYLLSQHLIDDCNDNAARQLYIKIVQSLEAAYGKRQVNVSHLKSFGGDGLKALTASILREEATMKLHPPSDTNTNAFITVRFKVPHHNTEFHLPWYYNSTHADGQTSTLLDLRNTPPDGTSLLSEYIEASCGGNCSCSTCHVYIDTTTTHPDHAIDLSPVTEAEEEMLDLAYQPTDQSRLACQVRLLKLRSSSMVPPNEPLLTVIIPSGSNDFWK